MSAAASAVLPSASQGASPSRLYTLSNPAPVTTDGAVAAVAGVSPPVGTIAPTTAAVISAYLTTNAPLAATWHAGADSATFATATEVSAAVRRHTDRLLRAAPDDAAALAAVDAGVKERAAAAAALRAATAAAVAAGADRPSAKAAAAAAMAVMGATRGAPPPLPQWPPNGAVPGGAAGGDGAAAEEQGAGAYRDERNVRELRAAMYKAGALREAGLYDDASVRAAAAAVREGAPPSHADAIFSSAGTLGTLAQNPYSDAGGERPPSSSGRGLPAVSPHVRPTGAGGPPRPTSAGSGASEFGGGGALDEDEARILRRLAEMRAMIDGPLGPTGSGAGGATSGGGGTDGSRVRFNDSTPRAAGVGVHVTRGDGAPARPSSASRGPNVAAGSALHALRSSAPYGVTTSRPGSGAGRAGLSGATSGVAPLSSKLAHGGVARAGARLSSMAAVSNLPELTYPLDRDLTATIATIDFDRKAKALAEEEALTAATRHLRNPGAHVVALRPDVGVSVSSQEATTRAYLAAAESAAWSAVMTFAKQRRSALDRLQNECELAIAVAHHLSESMNSDQLTAAIGKARAALNDRAAARDGIVRDLDSNLSVSGVHLLASLREVAKQFTALLPSSSLAGGGAFVPGGPPGARRRASVALTANSSRRRSSVSAGVFAMGAAQDAGGHAAAHPASHSGGPGVSPSPPVTMTNERLSAKFVEWLSGIHATVASFLQGTAGLARVFGDAASGDTAGRGALNVFVNEYNARYRAAADGPSAMDLDIIFPLPCSGRGQPRTVNDAAALVSGEVVVQSDSASPAPNPVRADELAAQVELLKFKAAARADTRDRTAAVKQYMLAGQQLVKDSAVEAKALAALAIHDTPPAIHAALKERMGAYIRHTHTWASLMADHGRAVAALATRGGGADDARRSQMSKLEARIEHIRSARRAKYSHADAFLKAERDNTMAHAAMQLTDDADVRASVRALQKVVQTLPLALQTAAGEHLRSLLQLLSTEASERRPHIERAARGVLDGYDRRAHAALIATERDVAVRARAKLALLDAADTRSGPRDDLMGEWERGSAALLAQFAREVRDLAGRLLADVGTAVLLSGPRGRSELHALSLAVNAMLDVHKTIVSDHMVVVLGEIGSEVLDDAAVADGEWAYHTATVDVQLSRVQAEQRDADLFRRHAVDVREQEAMALVHEYEAIVRKTVRDYARHVDGSMRDFAHVLEAASATGQAVDVTLINTVDTARRVCGDMVDAVQSGASVFAHAVADAALVSEREFLADSGEADADALRIDRALARGDADLTCQIYHFQLAREALTRRHDAGLTKLNAAMEVELKRLQQFAVAQAVAARLDPEDIRVFVSYIRNVAGQVARAQDNHVSAFIKDRHVIARESAADHDDHLYSELADVRGSLEEAAVAARRRLRDLRLYHRQQLDRLWEDQTRGRARVQEELEAAVLVLSAEAKAELLQWASSDEVDLALARYDELAAGHPAWTEEAVGERREGDGGQWANLMMTMADSSRRGSQASSVDLPVLEIPTLVGAFGDEPPPLPGTDGWEERRRQFDLEREMMLTAYVRHLQALTKDYVNGIAPIVAEMKQQLATYLARVDASEQLHTDANMLRQFAQSRNVIARIVDANATKQIASFEHELKGALEVLTTEWDTQGAALVDRYEEFIKAREVRLSERRDVRRGLENDRRDLVAAAIHGADDIVEGWRAGVEKLCDGFATEWRHAFGPESASRPAAAAQVLRARCALVAADERSQWRERGVLAFDVFDTMDAEVAAAVAAADAAAAAAEAARIAREENMKSLGNNLMRRLHTDAFAGIAEAAVSTAEDTSKAVADFQTVLKPALQAMMSKIPSRDKIAVGSAQAKLQRLLSSMVSLEFGFYGMCDNVIAAKAAAVRDAFGLATSELDPVEFRFSPEVVQLFKEPIIPKVTDIGARANPLANEFVPSLFSDVDAAEPPPAVDGGWADLAALAGPTTDRDLVDDVLSALPTGPRDVWLAEIAAKHGEEQAEAEEEETAARAAVAADEEAGLRAVLAAADESRGTVIAVERARAAAKSEAARVDGERAGERAAVETAETEARKAVVAGILDERFEVIAVTKEAMVRDLVAAEEAEAAAALFAAARKGPRLHLPEFQPPAPLPQAPPDAPAMLAVWIHAVSAPSTLESIADVAAYLTTQGVMAGASPVQRVSAIFRWIAHTIAFNVGAIPQTNGQLTAERGPQLAKVPDTDDAETAFKARKTLSCGYAKLFEALCSAAGIEVATITGKARASYNFTHRYEADSLTEHHWNAVKLHDAWRLVDCSWGSGYLERTTSGAWKFIAAWDASYLFADPAAFGRTHHPEDPEWQMKGTAFVQLDAFAAAPFVRERFQTVGWTLLDELDTTETLQAPTGVLEVAFTCQHESTVVNATITGAKGQTFPRDRLVCMPVPADDGSARRKWKILATFPNAGEFTLELSSKSAFAKVPTAKTASESEEDYYARIAPPLEEYPGLHTVASYSVSVSAPSTQALPRQWDVEQMAALQFISSYDPFVPLRANADGTLLMTIRCNPQNQLTVKILKVSEVQSTTAKQPSSVVQRRVTDPWECVTSVGFPEVGEYKLSYYGIGGSGGFSFVGEYHVIVETAAAEGHAVRIAPSKIGSNVFIHYPLTVRHTIGSPVSFRVEVPVEKFIGVHVNAADKSWTKLTVESQVTMPDGREIATYVGEVVFENESVSLGGLAPDPKGPKLGVLAKYTGARGDV